MAGEGVGGENVSRGEEKKEVRKIEERVKEKREQPAEKSLKGGVVVVNLRIEKASDTNITVNTVEGNATIHIG